MRRHLRLRVFVRKQSAAHKQAADKPTMTIKLNAPRSNGGYGLTPHSSLSKSSKSRWFISQLHSSRNTRPDCPVFDSSIYYFSETPTNLIVEGLFYAVSLHAFVMHQRIKLAFH